MDNESEQKREEKKEQPLNELLTSSIVDIYVGPNSTHWCLHERLLCYHSPFFSSIFSGDAKDSSKKYKDNKSYSVPDDDDYPFELLVGWLYSRAIRQPRQEKDLGPLLDLYLLSEKFQMKNLGSEVVDIVRDWYYTTSTYPGLRRVQYIYAETDEDNEMREMMVSSVARQLTTTDKIPVHWVNALQRNGQLAVDIIRSIQQWHLEERSIPDMRDGSRGRRRLEQGSFSTIEREGADSMETTGTFDTDLGVESVNSGLEKTSFKTEEEQGQERPQLPPRTPERRTEPPDKMEEEPTDKVGEEPTHKVEEEPAQKAEEEPAHKAEEEPTHKVEEEPTEKVDKEPTGKVEEGPTDKEEDEESIIAAVSRKLDVWLSTVKKLGNDRPEILLLAVAWILFLLYHIANYANLVLGNDD